MDIQRILSDTRKIISILKRNEKYNFPLCIDDIKDAICEISKCKVVYLGAEWGDKDSQIRSNLNLYETTDSQYPYRADIRYKLSLNTCWTRFSLCKELCHILIDSKDTCTDDLSVLISIFAGEIPPALIDRDTNEVNAWKSEELAEIVALELMFPIGHRELVRKKLDEPMSDLSNRYECALDYMIPVHYISRGIGSQYLKLITEGYNALD